MSSRSRDGRPNVILVITDDQGYGDLGCTGNPWLQTPRIDAFSRQAMRLEGFHVAPLCTPTRAMILSGTWPIRNGAWGTCWGRSILRSGWPTMAEVFRDGGYATGMFGKWHLGDNYPYRPQDRGFTTVVAHKGGGVGQTPDFWGNDYFDDTYFANGAPTRYDGYCTDVWFDQALRFIEQHRNEPFFCYLATNAPHSPYLVDESYAAPYRGDDGIVSPEFYGMIANIDANFGRLVDSLDAWGLADDTILIFMTDNGSSGGCETGGDGVVRRGYNAGMRGKKGSYYEGGHRVPFYIRWGDRIAAREDRRLTCGADLLPTFIDLCGLTPPQHARFDGVSLAGLLTGRDDELPEREVFFQYRQTTTPPQQWTCAVASGPWRLVLGRELYDVEADPGQQRDVAAEHPDLVARLRAAQQRLWDEVAPTLETYARIHLGSDHENPTTLCAMDLTGDVAWSQEHIREALAARGGWAVHVERPGRYRFSLRRWPPELDAALCGTGGGAGVAVAIRHARLQIAGVDRTVAVDPDAPAAVFEVDLPAGDATLLAELHSGTEYRDRIVSAYYVDVERIGS